MRRDSRWQCACVSVLAVAASLAFAAGAGAAPITVGSPLSASFTTSGAETQSYLSAASILAEPGAHAASPVDGTIVRWHLTGASGTGFELRVLHPSGGGSYSWTLHSSPVTPAGTGLEAFSTSIPISTGDLVALYVPPEGTEGIASAATGSEAITWEPALAEATAEAPQTTFSNLEYSFNAEVLPPPTILSISPSSGPTAGGTSVTIAGTNFIEVKGVEFGANPARSFSVSSEGVISAVAPSGVPGQVPISVTTAAGTTVSHQLFVYTAPESDLFPPPTAKRCLVPNLKGKTLKRAKGLLKAAGCKLGQVTKKKGVTATTGKVVRQGKKQGTSLAAGSKVGVKLG